MVKSQLSINLLGDKNGSVTEQFLTWALAIGRLLVIITETIALAAFLYRFSIDRKLIDLHDQIKQYSIIVSYDKNNEQKFRDLQEKLAISKKQADTTTKLTGIFTDVMRLGNENAVTFNKLTTTHTAVDIIAQAGSIDGLATFVSKLKQHPSLTSVTVEKVENKTTNAVIIVTLSAVLQEGKNKPL